MDSRPESTPDISRLASVHAGSRIPGTSIASQNSAAKASAYVWTEAFDQQAFNSFSTTCGNLFRAPAHHQRRPTMTTDEVTGPTTAALASPVKVAMTSPSHRYTV